VELVVAKIKNKRNIFTTPQDLKEWSMDLAEACGSIITNKKPNISKIDNLVSKFVDDYNKNMESLNATKEEE
tara:strand:- start:83 stop:298 length:216 start_codon:yes stop_codon:yes gene_type:complete